jgi:hypothetical protein
MPVAAPSGRVTRATALYACSDKPETKNLHSYDSVGGRIMTHLSAMTNDSAGRLRGEASPLTGLWRRCGGSLSKVHGAAD